MATEKSVGKAWSESIGRDVAFDFETVESVDGRKQVEMRSKESGSLVAVANGDEKDALQRLEDNAGALVLDDPFTVQEREGNNQANQVNKADSSVPKPGTNPGPADEAEKGKDADKTVAEVKSSGKDSKKGK